MNWNIGRTTTVPTARITTSPYLPQIESCIVCLTHVQTYINATCRVLGAMCRKSCPFLWPSRHFTREKWGPPCSLWLLTGLSGASVLLAGQDFPPNQHSQRAGMTNWAVFGRACSKYLRRARATFILARHPSTKIASFPQLSPVFRCSRQQKPANFRAFSACFRPRDQTLGRLLVF